MPAFAPATAANPIKVILDTDIGDDIDDALALALILASPELELLGVTTVYGNVEARSRQARTELVIANRPEVPVAMGCGASLATRPNETPHAKLDHVPSQDSTCLPAAQLPKGDPRHGVDFLIDTIMAGNGDIIPIAIGALTNLAMALVKEPRIKAKIPRFVLMAAEFRRGGSEWNIRCDPEAAFIVFNSGIPCDVTTWHIGDVAKFTNPDIQRLLDCKQPVAGYLHRAIKAWQNNGPAMPSLFDPLAVATMINPGLCTWKPAVVQVDLQGSDAVYAITTMRESPTGHHRVAWDVNRDAAITWYLDRVCAYAGGHARAAKAAR
jgi:purine nucleosidase/pyrimidine-specific ribonucleoside hydrolase